MKQHIIFISARQISQLDFEHPTLAGAVFSLITSDEERKNIDRKTASMFRQVVSVPVSRRDDILFVYDQAAVVAAILKLQAPNERMSIVCFDEGNTVTAAYAREKLSLTGSTADRLRLFRNKVEMKGALETSGISIPAYTELSHFGAADYGRLSEKLGVPFVIKPIESAGSNGVHVIDSEAGFAATFADIGEHRDQYEVESFIRGHLYHCDLALFDGKPVFAECTEYLASTIDFQKGTPLGGQVMLPEHAYRDMLIDFTSKAVRALGGIHGVFHTEVFVDESGQAVFLESGARPPGMLVTRMYELATGVNLLNLDVCIQLGQVEASYQDRIVQQAFYLVYPTQEGVVAGVNAAPDYPGVHIEYRCHAKEGDRHKACTSNLDFAAMVVCAGHGEAFAASYRQAAAYRPVSYQ